MERTLDFGWPANYILHIISHINAIHRCRTNRFTITTETPNVFLSDNYYLRNINTLYLTLPKSDTHEFGWIWDKNHVRWRLLGSYEMNTHYTSIYLNIYCFVHLKNWKISAEQVGRVIAKLKQASGTLRSSRVARAINVFRFGFWWGGGRKAESGEEASLVTARSRLLFLIFMVFCNYLYR